MARIGSGAVVTACRQRECQRSQLVEAARDRRSIVDVELGLEVTSLAIGAAIGSGGDGRGRIGHHQRHHPDDEGQHRRRRGCRRGRRRVRHGRRATSRWSMWPVPWASRSVQARRAAAAWASASTWGACRHHRGGDRGWHGPHADDDDRRRRQRDRRGRGVRRVLQLAVNGGRRSSTSGAGSLNVLVNVTNTRALVNDDLNDQTTARQRLSPRAVPRWPRCRTPTLGATRDRSAHR